MIWWKTGKVRRKTMIFYKFSSRCWDDGAQNYLPSSSMRWMVLALYTVYNVDVNISITFAVLYGVLFVASLACGDTCCTLFTPTTQSSVCVCLCLCVTVTNLLRRYTEIIAKAATVLLHYHAKLLRLVFPLYCQMNKITIQLEQRDHLLRRTFS